MRYFFCLQFFSDPEGSSSNCKCILPPTAHFFLTTQTTTATMSNDRTRSLPSSSFSSSAGEARSRPRRRIEVDPRGAPAPDPAAAQPSLAAGRHLSAPSTKKSLDARWYENYQELVDYQAKHGVSFYTKVDTHCSYDFLSTQQALSTLHTALRCTAAVQGTESRTRCMGVETKKQEAHVARCAHQSLGRDRL